MELIRPTVLFALFASTLGKVDKTREPNVVGSSVVDAVVDMVTESCIFGDDALFLRRVAYAATMDGRDQKTFMRNGTNYYGGIWQVDKSTFDKTLEAVELFDEIEATFDIDWKTVVWSDLLRPLYSGLAARIAIHQTSKEVQRSIDEQAALWTEKYQTISNDVNSMVERFVEYSKSLPSQCETPKADLVFVLDASGSIELGNFVLMKEFVANVVKSFSISSTGVRVSVVTYSDHAQVEFDLEEYDDKEELLQAIRNVPYLTGSTNSADALRKMSQVLSDQGRGGSGVPEIGIFMTDGQSQDTRGTADAADYVHAQKLTVFAIGITDNVNKEEVERIGTDPDCVHVYYLTTFEDVTHFAEQIERQACKAPAELVPGEEVIDDLLIDSSYFFKSKVSKEEGATVSVEMLDGGVEVYLSYDVRTPSKEVHEVSFTATSAEGVCGMYLPFPCGEECSEEENLESGSRNRREAQDDTVEIYGTVKGLNPGMKNWYKLKVVEGWEEIGSGSSLIAGSAAIISTTVVAFLAVVY